MDFILLSIGTTIGGLILFAITSAFVSAPGAVLQNKFVQLGDMTGKSFYHISAAVGPPTSVSNIVSADGMPITVRQWMATGYHISLIFDQNDIFIGINHQSQTGTRLTSTPKPASKPAPQPAPKATPTQPVAPDHVPTVRPGFTSKSAIEMAEEIEKYMKLRDSDIISEEDFQQKKRQIIGL